MKVVIITGVSGFLGRYIAKHFHAVGWRVVGVDSVAEENSPREFLQRYEAMRLPDEMLSQCVQEERPMLLVHCAGRASVGLSMSDPECDFQGNTVLTFQLLESLRRHARDCRFVLLSKSAAVYGNPITLPVSEEATPSPISPYGFHKRQAELACEEFAAVYGMRTSSVRIFSAYGPGLRRQVLWDLTTKAVKADKLCLMGTGEESRDFIHARDVAVAVDLIADRGPLEGEVYNLASGCETSISSLAQQILKALDSPIPIEFDGNRPPGVPSQWRADITELTKLGFLQTIPLHQGVEEYVRWAMALIG